MKELDEYKEIYSRFIALIADLHNVHVLYTRTPSRDHGVDVRRVIRDIRIVQKELWDASQKASNAFRKERGVGRPKKDKNKNG